LSIHTVCTQSRHFRCFTVEYIEITQQAMLKNLILYYLENRFGVTSLKFIVNGKRVLLNLIGILLILGCLLHYGSSNSELNLTGYLAYGVVLAIAAWLLDWSDRV